MMVVTSTDLGTLPIIKTGMVYKNSVVGRATWYAVELNTKAWYVSRMNHIKTVCYEGDVHL
jgi:hypothetical protein